MTAPTLEISNLDVVLERRDATVPVIRDFSLTIQPGEIIGVVGESGAGKSTVGAAINGLLTHPARMTGGEIRLQGERIDTLSETQWQQVRGRRIGAVFQDPLTSLNPLFTIGEQLVETIRIHLPLSRSQARGRAIDLLREVGIAEPEDKLSHYPHQFSGGMRQRVVIALALCADPDLIIADEPTSALDVSIQKQIISLLSRICRERRTAMILISHDLGIISEASHRIAVMYCGRIVEFGKTDDVIGSPQHPYTIGLIDCIPNFERRKTMLADIGGELPRPDQAPAGCSFHTRCPQQLDRCSSDLPNRVVADDRMVMCWLHDPATHAAA